MWTAIKTRAKGVLIPSIAAVLGGLAVILYLRFAPKVPTYDPTPQPVQTAKEPKVITRKVTKLVQVPGPERIVYLDKQETATALKMPELATNPDNVLAAVTIPCPDRNVTAVSTLSPTGEGRILCRTEPQSFFQLKKEFGVRAGVGSGGLIVAEVYARPLRIGSVSIETRAWANRTDRDGADFGGAVLLDYRF